jgi:5-methylcytosine-specific restriction endonuclease McrA
MKTKNIERLRFLENPFQFALSAANAEGRKKSRVVHLVSPCCFCGSAKILGDVQGRKARKGGRVFCDEQCASEWKSIHYASANHKPMELQRQETRAKQQQRLEQSELKRREKEAAKALKPANQKTPGYYTCTTCGKTEWVESHANKRFCSRECQSKSPKAKAIRKLSKRNRRHKTRSKSSVAQSICINQLMKRDRRRCKQCNTLCVKPEGYNHPNEGTIDHIMPLSKGGLHLWNNVQLLCRQCNTAKRDVVLPGTQMMLRFAP